jgi:hypothetical protein
MRTVLNLLATAACFLFLMSCRSNGDGCYGCCLDNSCSYYDFAYTQDLDFASPPDLDFGQPDFDHHHRHHDLGQLPEDFAQPVVDLAEPIPDLATQPDMARSIQACTSCLSASCSPQVPACQSDPSCVSTLSCVVSNGCFTFAGGSESFATCVDGCVSSELLTLPQTVAVLNEIAALSACTESCVDVCGGS